MAGRIARARNRRPACRHGMNWAGSPRIARERGVKLHMDGARLWEAREAYAPNVVRRHLRALRFRLRILLQGHRCARRRDAARSGGFHRRSAHLATPPRWHAGAIASARGVRGHALRCAAGENACVPRARALRSRQRWQRSTASSSCRNRREVNLFHAHFPVSAAALIAARDAIAAEHRAWLLQRIVAGRLPGLVERGDLRRRQPACAADSVVVPLFAQLLERARGRGNMSAKGRPEREYRSAKREGTRSSAKGRRQAERDRAA